MVIHFQVSRDESPVEEFFISLLSGRIMLNRTMKIDRYLDIDLEPKSLPIAAEHGDALSMEKPFHNQLSPSYDLYKQSNA